MATVLGRPLVCPVLVGRAGQAAVLRDALERAAAGRGGALLVSGEAGVGKSRLVAVARAEAAGRSFSALVGACFEPDRGVPYAPVRDLGRPELGALAERGDKHALLDALAARAPTLLVVEDLHWCDEATLDLLLHVARRAAELPLLLLLTYRPDERSPALAHLLAELDRARLTAELALAPLGRGEVEAMLRAIFGLPGAPSRELVDALHGLTEGNPFFVEEVLTSLVAAGDVTRAGAGWERRPLEELRIPRSVQDAVGRRVGGLSEATRGVLVLAAVAGRRFDFALLRELTGAGEDELTGRVKELIAAGLVVEERDGSGDVFAFRHALTRHAVYGGLLARERRALHGRVGAALERLHADALDAHRADLAEQFHAAEEWDKVLEHAPRAGEIAQERHAPRAAAEHFGRAIAAAEKLGVPRETTTWRRARAKARETVGLFDLARADYEAVLEEARAGGDRRAACDALIDLGFAWTARDYARTGDYFEEALATAREAGDPATLARALNRYGNWHPNVGRPLEARPYHEEALAVYRSLGDRAGVAETLALLGTVHYVSADPVPGAARFAQAAELYRQLGDPAGLAGALAQLAGASLQELSVTTGTLAESIEHAAESAAIAHRIGWRAQEAHSLGQLGSALGHSGDFGAALARLREGLAIAEEIGHGLWTSYLRLALGRLYYELFAFDEAARQLELSIGAAQAARASPFGTAALAFTAIVWVARGRLAEAATQLDALGGGAPTVVGARAAAFARVELALARGDAEAALTGVDALVAVTPDTGDRGPLAVAWLARLRGEALTGLRRWDEAEGALRAAEALELARGARTRLWRIVAGLARMYRAQGRRDAAEPELARARALVAELGAAVPEGELREGFLAGVAAHVPPPTARQAARAELGGLTAREREVAALLAEGRSNRQIAEALVLSQRTVANHVANILDKLELTSRTQVAAWYLGIARDEK